ncbi:MAG TPA: DUF2130 domain-containing protein [Chitinophagaceae bacterium]|nr:DUF2130 domain-containing protein [Chitinophagaceae bacterium]
MGTEIICPSCNTRFVLEDAISAEIQKEMRNKMETEWRKRVESLQAEKNQVTREKEDLEKQKLLQQTFLEEKIRDIKKESMDEAGIKAREDSAAIIRNLEEEKQLKLLQIQEMQIRELDLLREKSALEQRQKDFDRELEKKLLESRMEIEEHAARREREISDLKIKEMQKKLDDQTRLADEMKRKADQGSMQLQGEVQELALEELLRNSFPFDEVQEIGKGKKGADCVLVVRNAFGQQCGKIVFESKRTQDFGPSWIEKVKMDMQIINADMAVIVTQAMPKDMDERFGHREGVWICSFADVKSLTLAFRDGLIKLFTASKSQENRGEKMQMLYGYLTSNEFTNQWGAIREGFHMMQQSIQKERDAMEKLWKSREKQLEKVLLNAAHIQGSIEGIAGRNAVDLNLLGGESEESLLGNPIKG